MVVSFEQRRAVAVLLRRGHTLSPDQEDAAQVVVDHAARQRWFALFYAVIGLAMGVLFVIGQTRRTSELVFGGLWIVFAAVYWWNSQRLVVAGARQGITRTRRS